MTQPIQMELFGIPVHRYSLSIDNTPLINYSYKLRQQQKSRQLSNNGGWQSEDLSVDTKEIVPLIEAIKHNILLYIQHCSFKKLEYKLDSMWININGYKDSNVNHIHPKSVFSGVYYIQTPKDCGDIVFQHPSQHIIYDWNNKVIEETTSINSSNWWLPSKQGNLYIFPSWLFHYVKPNLNKEQDRISIAFNINV
jgi:uncharacterized protein (TIGR02466 family)